MNTMGDIAPIFKLFVNTLIVIGMIAYFSLYYLLIKMIIDGFLYVINNGGLLTLIK